MYRNILTLFLVTFPFFTLFSQGLNITSRTPGINALNITADYNIEIVFDKDINAATVNENTFNVDGNMTGEIPGSFNTVGNTITFNPANNFSPGEIVTVILTTGLLASDATSLANSITWQFTVKSSTAAMQITGQEMTTSLSDPPFDATYCIHSADLDGDGDMDILSTSKNHHNIAWYENTDGLATFSAQKVITTSTSGARSVYSADLDGDGDMDVLSASDQDDEIAWYKNNGAGTFGAQQVITTSADYAISVYSADLDGDGDMDVLSASQDDDKIAWYENTDGLGTFGAQKVITTSADDANSVYSADLDGDGDMDVLSASWNDDKIAWYENTDGLGTFGAQKVITTSTDGASSVYSTDLDGDGDMDVLAASYYDDNIAWYENTDGLGTFGAQKVITTSTDGARSVYSADLDGDGDMDVLSASSTDSKIAWYENTDGAGTFGTQQVISTLAYSAMRVYSADLDDDDDMDVLAALFDNRIAWYINKSLGTSTDFTETINKNSILTITSSQITYSETIQSNPQLSTKIITAPDKGELFNDQDGNNIAGGAEILGNGDTVSKADIDNGFLKYKPLPNESGSPYSTFTFRVVNKDGESLSAYTGTINIVLLGPSISTNTGATLDEGGTFTFSDLCLKANDADGPSYSLTYNVTKAPVCGSLTNSGALMKADGTETSSFTQNDIANGKVKYTHDGGESLDDQFAFKVIDSDGLTSAEDVFEISINGINDPPTIGTLSPITFNEDDGYMIDFTNWYPQIEDHETPDSMLAISLSSLDKNVLWDVLDRTTWVIFASENYFGYSTFEVRVCDGESECYTTVDLIIKPINDLPQIIGFPTSISFVSGESEIIELNGKATDIETPDSLLTWSFSVSPDSVNVSYNAATKIVTLSAIESFDGQAGLTIKVTDADGETDEEVITVTVDPDPTGVENLNGIPTEYTLFQNYPNPFNPTTVIRYGIPSSTDNLSVQCVQLKIYDILGNEVAILVNEQQSSGYYEYNWNAENNSSGIYFFVLSAGKYREIRKMLLIK